MTFFFFFLGLRQLCFISALHATPSIIIIIIIIITIYLLKKVHTQRSLSE